MSLLVQAPTERANLQISIWRPPEKDPQRWPFITSYGDAPYLKQLADRYAMSDNYHQAVMGGTGANHIMLGTGDAIWFSDGEGHPAVPPHNQMVGAGTPNAGVVDEIENPNAQPGTNNWYTEDG